MKRQPCKKISLKASIGQKCLNVVKYCQCENIYVGLNKVQVLIPMSTGSNILRPHNILINLILSFTTGSARLSIQK